MSDRWRRLMKLLVLASVLLSGCYSTEPEERAWTEDVLLPDARTITVKRAELITQHSSWAGDASLVETVGSTLNFTGALASLPKWDQPLMLRLVYQDEQTREWVAVATTVDCRVWEKRGRPKPPYWEFRLTATSWREVPLSAASIGKKANLVDVTWLKDHEHVTTPERDRLMREARPVRRFREVWGDPDQYVCREGDVGKV